MTSSKVKNIESNIQGKENDSQSSNSSRKDSIENVLSMLMESSSLKMEVFLSFTLFMILICALVSFLISFNVFLIWDNEIKEKTPTFMVISVLNLRSLFNNVLNW